MAVIHHLEPRRTPLERKLLDLPYDPDEDIFVPPFDSFHAFDSRAGSSPAARDGTAGDPLQSPAGGSDNSKPTIGDLTNMFVLAGALWLVIFLGLAL